MYYPYIKRLNDIVISFTLLITLSPLFLMTVILLAIANRGKVFFVQARPGKNEKIFHLIKFKTMNDLKDSNGKLLPDEKRLTIVGKFVRKASIDEIPQLINVLKGNMSLIGPRPWLVEYLPLYNDYQRKRHNVRPGITGWAQVNGRNQLSWDKRFEYDIYYVNHVSFALDSKIVLLTLKNVFLQKGIAAEGSVSMPKFEGNIK